MSILKSILHHYNKTSASYDTLHPETEVSQITDWSQGSVNTLASTALGSLISTLSSDSLMAKLMKLVLDATGVKYLMDTNGYICFGSLFGGLIIQWVLTGNDPGASGGVNAILPIAFNNGPVYTVAVPTQLIAGLGMYVRSGGDKTLVYADSSAISYTSAYNILAIGY